MSGYPGIIKEIFWNSTNFYLLFHAIGLIISECDGPNVRIYLSHSLEISGSLGHTTLYFIY